LKLPFQRCHRRLLFVLAGTLGSLAAAGAASAAAPASFFQGLPASGNTELQTQRTNAVAAPLPDGKILIAGGEYSDTSHHVLRSAEIFDPDTSTFTPLPAAGNTEMNTARSGAMAAPLPDGRVLIAGGSDGSVRLVAAEIFNPADDTFTPLPDATDSLLHTPRQFGVAAPLPDGRVLITGGDDGGDGLASAEIFSPATMTFTALPDSGSTAMQTRRDGPAAAVLHDGRVLIVGGQNQDDNESRTGDVFDPTTNTFSPLPLGSHMAQARLEPVAATLPDGKVLIAGGFTASDGYLRSSELFDPATNTFAAGPDMGIEREGAVAATLNNGRILVASGYLFLSAANTSDWLQSAELFVPAPEARATGGDFGSQLVGTSSIVQTFVVTNIGSQPLDISAATLDASGNPSDFTVADDACAGESLLYKQSCTIGVRFTPSAAGARSARIDLSDNEQTPMTIALSGTGSVPGSGGSGGGGSSSSQHKPSQVDVLTCQAAHRRGHRGAVLSCTSKLVGGKVKLTKTTIRATLRRGRVVYATGSATAHGKKLTLNPRRTLRHGSYALTLKSPRRHGHRAITTSQTLTIR
jgi:hypothetical protein